MYQKVYFTGRVVEILQQGSLVEVKNSYTPKDGSGVIVKKAYIVVRDDNPDYDVDNLIHVKGRFIANDGGNPPVDKNSRARFIVKPQVVTNLGPYIDDSIESDLFEVDLVGYCGDDAVIRQTKTGKTVVNLSVGVSTSLGADGKEKCWFNLTEWGENSHLKNFKKRELVFVNGLVDYNPETGLPNSFQREDGTTQGKFELKFPYILHLTWNNGNGGEAKSSQPPEPDDIPF